MFITLVRKRRSIRKYDPRPVEAEKIEVLIEAALRSPSSMGSNPWKFIIVTDPAVLQRLSKAKPHGASFLKNAPMAMVVCADPGKSSVWIEDASIAALIIHLTAGSLDLGSCWIQIRDRMHDEEMMAESYIAELLDIPKHLKVEAMVAIGYPGEEKAPHPKETLQYEKIFHGSYGTPYPYRG